MPSKPQRWNQDSAYFHSRIIAWINVHRCSGWRGKEYVSKCLRHTPRQESRGCGDTESNRRRIGLYSLTQRGPQRSQAGEWFVPNTREANYSSVLVYQQAIEDCRFRIHCRGNVEALENDICLPRYCCLPRTRVIGRGRWIQFQNRYLGHSDALHMSSAPRRKHSPVTGRRETIFLRSIEVRRKCSMILKVGLEERPQRLPKIFLNSWWDGVFT